MKKHPRSLLFFFCLALIIGCFSMCMQEPAPPRDPRGGAFAGAQRCAECHREAYNDFLQTAHAVSTQPASARSIKGSFATGSNVFEFHPGLKVEMQQRGNGFYQVAYAHDTPTGSAPFDVVVGSGRKAQTYLYWQGDKVYQLPISYFVPAHSWVNSPNYPPHQVRFDRNIPIGCFECHGSFIRKTASLPEGDRLVDHFDKGQLVYGIDCERCHGPAAHHADFHAGHPDEKKARFLTPVGTLTRQNKVEMCAVCHAGLTDTRQTLFTFHPGSKLSDYVVPDTAHPRTADIDVHGKQYQLLQASACYLKSNTLDCSSCHNPHKKERDLALFSSRCMGCHQASTEHFCPLAARIGPGIAANCIDCHMPAQPSRLITLLSQGQKAPTPNFVRTHFIAVYPDATNRYFQEHKVSPK